MSAASQGHGVSMPTPSHVSSVHAAPAETAPIMGARATPRVSRWCSWKWMPMPTTAPTMNAMRICMSSGSGSGDEADAARLFGAELDVGQARGRDDVRVALGIGERHVRGAGVEGGGDGLLDVGCGLVRLEVELAAGVRDADADLHVTDLLRGAMVARCEAEAPRTHGNSTTPGRGGRPSSERSGRTSDVVRSR